MTLRELNQDTLELIKSFEGWYPKAYKDPVGIWTIGYGHTDMAGPPKVTPNLTLTREEGEELLRRDLKKYQAGVERLVKVSLNDNQYGALVSFTYNLGEGNLGKSTLLRKLNQGDYIGASKEFAKWDKAGGKVLKGLTRRREAERVLFLKKPLEVTQKPVQSIPSVPATEVAKKPTASPEAPVEPKFNLADFLSAIFKILKG